MTDASGPEIPAFSNHGMQSLLFFTHLAALLLLVSDLAAFLAVRHKGLLEQLPSGGAAGGQAADDLALFLYALTALCFGASGGYMAGVRYRLAGLFGVVLRLNCLLAAFMALWLAYSGVGGTAFQIQYAMLALLWALSLVSLRHGFDPAADRSLPGLFRAARRYAAVLCGLRRE